MNPVPRSAVALGSDRFARTRELVFVIWRDYAFPVAPGANEPQQYAPSLIRPSSLSWLVRWRWISAGSVLLILGGLLFPATTICKRPVESVVMRNLALCVKSYAWQNNGLWPTNWAQMTNSLFVSEFSSFYLRSPLLLQDHYVFIPHAMKLEIGEREPMQIVMLRSTPKTENSTPGRYAIAFRLRQNPTLREFEETWIAENKITNLLAQSGITLPPLQRDEPSRARWFSLRSAERRELLMKVAAPAALVLIVFCCLTLVGRSLPDRPIG